MFPDVRKNVANMSTSGTSSPSGRRVGVGFVGGGGKGDCSRLMEGIFIGGDQEGQQQQHGAILCGVDGGFRRIATKDEEEATVRMTTPPPPNRKHEDSSCGLARMNDTNETMSTSAASAKLSSTFSSIPRTSSTPSFLDLSPTSSTKKSMTLERNGRNDANAGNMMVEDIHNSTPPPPPDKTPPTPAAAAAIGDHHTLLMSPTPSGTKDNDRRFLMSPTVRQQFMSPKIHDKGRGGPDHSSGSSLSCELTPTIRNTTITPPDQQRHHKKFTPYSHAPAVAVVSPEDSNNIDSNETNIKTDNVEEARQADSIAAAAAADAVPLPTSLPREIGNKRPGSFVSLPGRRSVSGRFSSSPTKNNNTSSSTTSGAIVASIHLPQDDDNTGFDASNVSCRFPPPPSASGRKKTGYVRATSIGLLDVHSIRATTTKTAVSTMGLDRRNATHKRNATVEKGYQDLLVDMGGVRGPSPCSSMIHSRETIDERVKEEVNDKDNSVNNGSGFNNEEELQSTDDDDDSILNEPCVRKWSCLSSYSSTRSNSGNSSGNDLSFQSLDGNIANCSNASANDKQQLYPNPQHHHQYHHRRAGSTLARTRIALAAMERPQYQPSRQHSITSVGVENNNEQLNAIFKSEPHPPKATKQATKMMATSATATVANAPVDVVINTNTATGAGNHVNTTDRANTVLNASSSSSSTLGSCGKIIIGNNISSTSSNNINVYEPVTLDCDQWSIPSLRMANQLDGSSTCCSDSLYTRDSFSDRGSICSIGRIDSSELLGIAEENNSNDMGEGIGGKSASVTSNTTTPRIIVDGFVNGGKLNGAVSTGYYRDDSASSSGRPTLNPPSLPTTSPTAIPPPPPRIISGGESGDNGDGNVAVDGTNLDSSNQPAEPKQHPPHRRTSSRRARRAAAKEKKAIEWLEEVRGDETNLAEAASSKFLLTRGGAAACSGSGVQSNAAEQVNDRTISTPSKPNILSSMVGVGKNDSSSSSPSSVIEVAVSSGSHDRLLPSAINKSSKPIRRSLKRGITMPAALSMTSTPSSSFCCYPPSEK